MKKITILKLIATVCISISYSCFAETVPAQGSQQLKDGMAQNCVNLRGEPVSKVVAIDSINGIRSQCAGKSNLQSKASLVTLAKNKNADCGFSHSCDDTAAVVFSAQNKSYAIDAFIYSQGHYNVVTGNHKYYGCAGSNGVYRCVFTSN